MGDCTTPLASEGFRQGDIFVYRDWMVRDDWQHLGIVVTADCDIANDKIPGFLTFCPVIRFESYIRDVWAAKKVGDFVDKLVSNFQRILAEQWSRSGQAPVLSPDAVLHWCGSASAKDVVEKIGIEKPSIASDLEQVVQSIQASLKYAQGEGPTDYLQVLGHLKSLREAKDADQVEKTLRKQAHSEMRSVPQDVYYIADIPGLSHTEFGASGFMVLLRYVLPIGLNEICSGVAIAKQNGSEAVRVARLSSPYRFSFIRRFADLFSRVGLPEEFEQDQRIIVEETCKSLSFSGGWSDV